MAVTRIKDRQVRLTSAINGLIEVPETKVYVLSQYAPFRGRIIRLTAQQEVTVGVNLVLSVAVDAVSVTFFAGNPTITDDAEVQGVATANDTFDVGDTIALSLSVTGDPLDLAFTLEYERFESDTA